MPTARDADGKRLLALAQEAQKNGGVTVSDLLRLVTIEPVEAAVADDADGDSAMLDQPPLPPPAPDFGRALIGWWKKDGGANGNKRKSQ